MSKVNDGMEIRGAKGGAKGRSIHATRPFQPGDVIARFDDPAVVLPPGHHALEYCNHCMRKQGTPTVGKLRACTGCKTVAYCGPACQRANWALIHKVECKAIKRLHEMKPANQPDWVPTPIRAAVQVMLRPKVLATFDDLVGHVEAWKKKDEMDLQVQAHGVVRCLGVDTTTHEGLEAALQVLCKLQTNAFSRTEEDYYESGGVFLDTTLAMVNHSCVPNAMVQFGGRTGTLRATSFINPGDEIEISYIDHTSAKGKRQSELDPYHFECCCKKCKHDLDEYQLAMTDPTVELNSLSVMPDLQRFKNPPGGGKYEEPQAMEVLKLLKIFPVFPRDMKPKEKHEWLRTTYRSSSWFVKTGKWALEPFAQLVDEAAFYFGKDRGNHECALAVACLSAYDIEPFKHVVPFHPHRLKGLSSIAIALSNTAPNPEKLIKLARDMAATKKFPAERVKVLENLDQVSLCQMALSIIDVYSHLAPSADWEVLVLAKEMLQDIESLPGREKETSLIEAWRKDPKEMEEFFKFGLVEPIKTLSELGKVVLEVDLGSDRDLSAK